jgi:hypothetical protein
MENHHVVAGRDRVRPRVQARYPTHAALGQHVIEQHGVHPTDRQVAVRMDVVVVRHRANAGEPFGLEQDVVRDRAPERGDAPAAEVRQRAMHRTSRTPAGTAIDERIDRRVWPSAPQDSRRPLAIAPRGSMRGVRPSSASP